MIVIRIMLAVIPLAIGIIAALWAYRREDWFDDAGVRLKRIAKILFSFGLFISAVGCGSVLLLFVVFPLLNGTELTTANLLNLLIGIVSAAVTCLLSWLSSLGIHALGQIVDNTDPCPPPAMRINIPLDYHTHRSAAESRE